MKKIIIVMLVVASIGSFFSCDDQVNPKTNFKQVYALNCIIKSDTSYQIATISRSYDVNGYDPMSNTTDPFVAGATVKVFYNDSVFVFRDTSIARANDPRYITPMHFYYSAKLRPSETKPIKIQAELPDGTVLTSETQTYSLNLFYFIDASNTIPTESLSSPNISFSWNYLSETNLTNQVFYYAPELVIFYAKMVNGARVEMQKKVPMYYANDVLPLYPTVQANINSILFENNAIDKSMNEISEGDPNKQDYIIEKATFRLFVLDKNLAAYYAAQKTFLDEFSVRFNEPDFTNIYGGLGIFGTYNVRQTDLNFKEDYVLSFGYRTN